MDYILVKKIKTIFTKFIMLKKAIDAVTFTKGTILKTIKYYRLALLEIQYIKTNILNNIKNFRQQLNRSIKIKFDKINLKFNKIKYQPIVISKPRDTANIVPFMPLKWKIARKLSKHLSIFDAVQYLRS